MNFTQHFDHNKPLVIAHRGASAYAPENTLSAFLLAHQLGAQWLECDVQLTADHVPVILHDHRLKRTTQRPGMLHKTQAADLLELDVGSWFSEKFHAEKIPTLEQVLQFAQTHKMYLNLEIKPRRGASEVTATVVAEHLRKFSPHCIEYVLISSFDHFTLKIIRKLCPDINLALNCTRLHQQIINLAKDIQACSIHLNSRYNHRKQIQQVKDAGFCVGMYTINHKAKAERLFADGLNYIFSDYPDLISVDRHHE